MGQPPTRITLQLRQEIVPLLGYWTQLEGIHKGFDTANEIIEAVNGCPTCIEHCGKCCATTTPLAYGFEAEYVVSWLLGNRPDLIKEIRDRARAWLTSGGTWTYGQSLTKERLVELHDELLQVFNSRCPFLADDLRCMIHYARPLVCRAYGVTHAPDSWCPRPRGKVETETSRIWFDPDHPTVKIRPKTNALLADVTEPRYARQAFLPLMVFERLAAEELAGLVDEGKVPLVKLHQGIGEGMGILWQEQLDDRWRAEAAMQSIDGAVPLEDNDRGVPHMVVA